MPAVNRPSKAGRQSKFRAGHQRLLLAGRSHRESPGDGPLCVTLLTLVSLARINEGETGEGDASLARNTSRARHTAAFMGCVWRKACDREEFYFEPGQCHTAKLKIRSRRPTSSQARIVFPNLAQMKPGLARSGLR